MQSSAGLSTSPASPLPQSANYGCGAMSPLFAEALASQSVEHIRVGKIPKLPASDGTSGTRTDGRTDILLFRCEFGQASRLGGEMPGTRIENTCQAF